MKDTTVNILTFICVAILFFYIGQWVKSHKLENTYMTYMLTDKTGGKDVHDEFKGLVKDFKKCDAINHYE